MEGLKFAKTHEWVKVEDGIATIGLTDFAQKELGDIVFAEPEPAGTEVELEDMIGTVESVKAASDLFAPVSGVIVEANEAIEDDPEQINQAPWDAWFVKIKMANPAELDDLLDQAAYDAFCDEEGA